MRHTILAAVLILFFCGGAFAAQFGPPVAATEGFGDFSITAGYTRLSSTWGEDSTVFDGIDIDQHIYYLQGTMGLAQGWDIYLRSGASSLSADGIYVISGVPTSDEEFENGPILFASIGFNGRVYQGEIFSFGLFGQASYFDTFEDTAKSTGAIQSSTTTGIIWTLDRATASFDEMWMVDVGIAAQAKIEGVDLYFGPLFYYGRTETKSFVYGVQTTSSVTPGAPVSAVAYEPELEENGNIGLLIGARWPFKNNYSLDVEFQKRSNFNTSLALTYSF
ncbi:MAG: hypothetical protein K0A93_00330 [Desulfuromonadaceae bacterium]|nr:hypothetical protein [Desulfuromonadaceae bacterium]